MSSLGHTLVGGAGRGPVGSSERHSLLPVTWVWVRPNPFSLGLCWQSFFLVVGFLFVVPLRV